MDAHTADQKAYAGVVLCGGLSRRMGRSKADLPFGDETMVQRVVRRLSVVVPHVILVAAEDQVLPHMPTHVKIARDSLPQAGPLAGIAAGLGACPDEITAAYVTSCDVPFLRPAFVDAMLQRLDDYDLVIPFDDDHLHPLAAVYRTSLVKTIEAMLAVGIRRPRELLTRVNSHKVSTADMRAADPRLDTLLNLNHVSDYRDALIREGHRVPAWATPPSH